MFFSFSLVRHVVLSTGARGVGLLDFSCNPPFLVDGLALHIGGCREGGEEGAVGEENPPLSRYAFNFRQKVQIRVSSLCLLLAVCVVPALATANYMPSLVHEISNQPTTHNAASTPRKTSFTSTPYRSIEYFSHIPAALH